MEHRSSTSYKIRSYPIYINYNQFATTTSDMERSDIQNLINTQQNHRKPEEGLGGMGTN